MKNLKLLRIERNLTQKDVANFLKCNQTAVGKYERGELEPSLDTLKKLADFFGCSIDYLVGREDDFGVIKSEKTELPGNTKKTYHSVNSELFAKNADEEKTLSVFRQLSARDKAFFMRFVDNFAVTLQSSDKKA